MADLVIGCDSIVTASRDALSRMGEGRTHAAINSTNAPTAAFVRNTEWANPADACAAEVTKAEEETEDNKTTYELGLKDRGTGTLP